MGELSASIIYYFCIIAVIGLIVQIFTQWIAQLRKKDFAFRDTLSLNNPFIKISSFVHNWSYNQKLIGAICLAVIFSRFIVFLVGGTWSLYFTESHTWNFKAIWQKWDAEHYLYIARHGYEGISHEKAVLIAFYPLYPLFIKMMSFIFGDYFISGLIVSTISLGIASYFLYKLVEEQFGSSTATKAVVFLLASPFSVFLGLVNTESLFLALVLAFFYMLYKRRWLLASTIGFLGALTKNQGVLLLIPYIIEVTVALGDEWRFHRKKPELSLVLKTVTPVFLIPAGFFVYLLINYLIYGDPFQFLVFQKTWWHNSFGFFARNIESLWRQTSTYPNHAYRFSLMLLQPIIFIVSLIFLNLAIAKKIRPSIIAFSLVFLLISFSPTWLLSAPRYTTALFFIPMLLAILSKATLRFAFLSYVSTALMCFFIIVYVEGAML